MEQSRPPERVQPRRPPVVDVDYLIVGAGAAGMAFADSLLTETSCTMAIVDRNARPGGHWNDAYPFVRLHAPAALYGVNSLALGSGAVDTAGPNAGLYELASGAEVLAYFDRVMQQSFLASGRVQYFPMSEAGPDSTISSLVSGRTRALRARERVDATHSQTAVPSTHPPRYAVAPEVACIPPNDLPRRASGHSGYVVVGAGKTGIDACLWLLENGTEPDSIRWIVPRDPWLLNRVVYQPGQEFLAEAVRDLADQVEALALAATVGEVFERLEACGSVRRIDPSVEPRLYHCATVSDGELDELRRIRNVTRLGRVTRIERDRIVLQEGTIPTSPDWLHVDCSASGISRRATKPVFDGDQITLQWVRFCQPAFSAAFVGFVEATYEDEDEKNRICTPIAPPNEPVDWVRMMAIELSNRKTWSDRPEIDGWLARSRLDGFSSRLRALKGDEAEVLGHLQRYRAHVRPAVENLTRLLAG